MSISQAELKEIQDRCDLARPGPWLTERNNFIIPEMIADNCRVIWCDSRDVAYITAQGHDNGNADAAFIASARQDVPRLVEEILRLQRLLAEHGFKY